MAIILVVFGHLVAREDPAGVGWYGPLRMVVYLFHMPFFFYLSGYVAVLSGADRALTAATSVGRIAGASGAATLLLLGMLTYQSNAMFYVVPMAAGWLTMQLVEKLAVPLACWCWLAAGWMFRWGRVKQFAKQFVRPLELPLPSRLAQRWQ